MSTNETLNNMVLELLGIYESVINDQNYNLYSIEEIESKFDECLKLL